MILRCSVSSRSISATLLRTSHWCQINSLLLWLSPAAGPLFPEAIFMNNIGPLLGDEPQCIITPLMSSGLLPLPSLFYCIRFSTFFLHQRNTYTCLLFPSLNIYADKNISQCNAYHTSSNLKTFYIHKSKLILIFQYW